MMYANKNYFSPPVLKKCNNLQNCTQYQLITGCGFIFYPYNFIAIYPEQISLSFPFISLACFQRHLIVI